MPLFGQRFALILLSLLIFAFQNEAMTGTHTQVRIRRQSYMNIFGNFLNPLQFFWRFKSETGQFFRSVLMVLILSNFCPDHCAQNPIYSRITFALIEDTG